MRMLYKCYMQGYSCDVSDHIMVVDTKMGDKIVDVEMLEATKLLNANLSAQDIEIAFDNDIGPKIIKFDYQTFLVEKLKSFPKSLDGTKVLQIGNDLFEKMGMQPKKFLKRILNIFFLEARRHGGDQSKGIMPYLEG
ncbi:hypothetical protein Adt_31396 [Abeliophyllum distichum]|uniref:Uncharacterized protein n=1 Tax=Abeliophyllum distichum TaxID=126358 RepID=A0ABD1RE05_9LAMI